MTTVLVTGGAGFIGSHLADRLLAEGMRVISVDDLTTGRIANLSEARGYGKEFTFFNMDVRAEGLLALFERHRPEVVFHLAAQSGVRPSLEDPAKDASINVMGTVNVLECAIATGVRKVVYAASGGTIYGEPKRVPAKESSAQGSHPSSPYGISKKVAVDYLSFYQRYRGLDYTALALGNVYGPRQDPHGEAGVIAIFAAKMLANEACMIFGDGNQTRDYVFIDDVVHGFVRAFDRGSGRLVNIGTGLETSVNGLFKLLAETIGYTGEPGTGPLPPGELRRIALDISLAPSAIGWKPWTHLEDGLGETVAFLRGVMAAPTFAVRAADVDLEPEGLDPAQILAGSPEVSGAVLWESEDGRILRGVWRCTSGTVTDVEQDELFVVIEGRATIEVEGGPVLEVAPGSVCVLERGARTTWTVHEPLLKAYQITLHD